MWHGEDSHRKPLGGQVKSVEGKLMSQWRPHDIRMMGKLWASMEFKTKEIPGGHVGYSQQSHRNKTIQALWSSQNTSVCPTC